MTWSPSVKRRRSRETKIMSFALNVDSHYFGAPLMKCAIRCGVNKKRPTAVIGPFKAEWECPRCHELNYISIDLFDMKDQDKCRACKRISKLKDNNSVAAEIGD